MPIEKRKVKPGVYMVNGNYICFYNTDDDIQEIHENLFTQDTEKFISERYNDLYGYLICVRDSARIEYLEEAESLALSNKSLKK